MSALPSLRRRQAETAEPQDDLELLPGLLTEPEDLHLQSSWTGGSRLSARAATFGLWSTLLAGPCALLLVLLGSAGESAPPATRPAPIIDVSSERTAAEDFAERFVATWLTTPKGDQRQLEAFIAAPERLVLPKDPARVEQVGAAAITATAGGVWSVTVGATVYTPTPAVTVGPAGAGQTPTGPAVGERRYFLVPVLYADGKLIATALPGPVAGPATAEPTRDAYRYRQPPGAPVTDTVTDFLGALLAGSADITRYVTPGSLISPVMPAPYTLIDGVTVSTDTEPADGTAAPRDGEQLHALVTARAGTDSNQQISVQYALTLTARAGRWEITSVDLAPRTPGGSAPGSSTPAPPAEPASSTTTRTPNSPTS